MEAKFFDVHTHTHFAAFEGETDTVINRALDSGIWLINVGTQRDTSVGAVEVAQKYPKGVYAAVGLHPIHTEKAYHDPKELGEKFLGESVLTSGEKGFNYDFYKNLAKNQKVVAIGECGLDYYRLGEKTKEKQKRVFLRQIELAYEVRKPLMIHCRLGFKDLIDILISHARVLTSPPGVVHFFSGAKEEARKLLEMGFVFSFGGVVTFTRDYDEVVKYTPLDKILLETDAPYVSPVPYRGKRNEPAYIIETAKKIAELKRVSLQDIALNTTSNAKAVFGIID